ncbi:MAG: DUF2752 domain-containing protein [Actinobacteria bacterium]|nr:DUF2752 domain-containing protein [Actinomycetota bacterium]
MRRQPSPTSSGAAPSPSSSINRSPRVRVRSPDRTAGHRTGATRPLLQRIPVRSLLVAVPPRTAPVLVAAGALVGAGLVALADPATNHVPLCPMRAATGLDCPLCGGLRAVQDLVHGRIGSAASHNLLFVAALPFVAVVWLVWLRRSGREDRPPFTAPRWTLPALLLLAAGFTVLRNLPVLPWLGSA